MSWYNFLSSYLVWGFAAHKILIKCTLYETFQLGNNELIYYVLSACPLTLTLTLQGGLVATDVAVRHQELFTGLILSAPSVELDVGAFTVS